MLFYESHRLAHIFLSNLFTKSKIMMSFKIKGIHFNPEKPHYIFLPVQAFQTKKPFSQGYHGF